MRSENVSNKFFIIIGGNGFIGSHMQKYLKEKINNQRMIIIDPKSSNIINNENSSGFIKGNFENVYKKIIDEIEPLIKTNDIIEIHHLAAILGIDTLLNEKNYFNKEILLNYAVNDFLVNLKSKLKNPVNFVYYSSSEVYGEVQYQYENKGTDLQSIENSNFLRNRYNTLKSFNEYYFNDICNQLEYNYLIIRPYNVIGIGQREDFVIPKMIKNAFENKKITIYNGIQTRLFIYVEDFVDIVLKAVDKILDKKEFNYKILNIANSSNYISIKKLAQIISDKVSFQIKELIEIETIDNEIKTGQIKRIPDTDRQYNILKLIPKKKLLEIIDEYIKWYSEKLNK